MIPGQKLGFHEDKMSELFTYFKGYNIKKKKSNHE